MSKKIIFFDVDGTLVDVRPVKECIPESTIQAVHETRKKGNLCYLCTGRSLAEIYPYILDVGFDGIIGAGGDLYRWVMKCCIIRRSAMKMFIEL